jgi:hypothetical protein
VAEVERFCTTAGSSLALQAQRTPLAAMRW